MDTEIPKHRRHGRGLVDHLKRQRATMNPDERRSLRGAAIIAASEEIERILNLVEKIEEFQTLPPDVVDMITEILHP